MSETVTVSKKDYDALKKSAAETATGLTSLTKSFGDFVEKAKKTPAQGVPHPWQIFGAPHARKGEDPNTSRGYSFAKMMGVISGAIDPTEAKVEVMEVHGKLHKHVSHDRGDGGYAYTPCSNPERRFLAPLCTKFLPDVWIDAKEKSLIREMVAAGMDGADPDEMRWIRQRQYKSMGFDTKALSWLNELTGGSLVAPPEQGELIELLRNKEALVNAGARTVPLPPQGRIKYPRQTLASNTYWVGENQGIPDSDIGTGEVTLQAKKLAVMIITPNELIRFANPAAEALMRDDMTKSLALGLDLACLEGQGGDHRPRGLINLPNINRITSSAPGVNGDRIVGNDVYRMIAAVEESNAEFEGFLMRPKTLYKYYQLRADAVSQGDGQGPFLFSLIREAGEGVKATIAGHPVTKSTQVSQVRSKGSASNLTYEIGGMFSDALIGMFGALEFAATTMGDTSFRNDQTWVRGILSCDFNVRHEAAFVLVDNLDITA